MGALLVGKSKHALVSSSAVLEYNRVKLPRFSRNTLFDAIFKHRRQANVVATASGDAVMADPSNIGHHAQRYYFSKCYEHIKISGQPVMQTSHRPSPRFSDWELVRQTDRTTTISAEACSSLAFIRDFFF